MPSILFGIQPFLARYRTGAVAVLAVVSSATSWSCGGGLPAAESHPAGGASRRWVFATTNGQAVSSSDALGRNTVLVFLSSYDPISQVAAVRLEQCLHTLPRRVNAFAVAMEPPDHQVLVSTFHDSLKLSYPMLMPDPVSLAGEGPFGVIQVAPTWVLLDVSGREIWRGVGLDALPELGDQVVRVEPGADRKTHGCGQPKSQVEPQPATR